MAQDIAVWWSGTAKPWLIAHRWPIAALVVLVALWCGREWAAAAIVTAGAALAKLRAARAPKGPTSGTRPVAEEVTERLDTRAERELAESKRELDASRRHAVQSVEAADEVRTMTDEELLKFSQEYARRKRRDRGPLLVFVVALASAWTAPAAALDGVRSDDVAKDVVRPDTGASGFWVAPWLWRETLADAVALPECVAARESADRATVHAQLAAEERKDAVELCRAVVVELRSERDEALRERDEAREQRDAWYRSPWTMSAAFALGVLISTAGALAMVSR